MRPLGQRMEAVCVCVDGVRWVMLVVDIWGQICQPKKILGQLPVHKCGALRKGCYRKQKGGGSMFSGGELCEHEHQSW